MEGSAFSPCLAQDHLDIEDLFCCAPYVDGDQNQFGLQCPQVRLFQKETHTLHQHMI